MTFKEHTVTSGSCTFRNAREPPYRVQVKENIAIDIAIIRSPELKLILSLGSSLAFYAYTVTNFSFIALFRSILETDRRSKKFDSRVCIFHLYTKATRSAALTLEHEI